VVRLPHLLALVPGLLAAGCGGSDSLSGIVSPPATVTLAEVQTQVFSPRCAVSGCHTGPTAPFGLDLSAGQSFGNTVGVASEEQSGFLRVEPFDPADSYLYMKLVDDPRISGDPMPLSGGALSAGQLALVESWITQGAL
jgi:hypothetical protein